MANPSISIGLNGRGFSSNGQSHSITSLYRKYSNASLYVETKQSGLSNGPVSDQKNPYNYRNN